MTTPSRFAIVYPPSDIIQGVAHCEAHAKLLCLLINACDLSDPASSVLRVLDALAYVVSEEVGCMEHLELNIAVVMKNLQDWLLLTIEKNKTAAVVLCAHRPHAASITDFLKVRP